MRSLRRKSSRPASKKAKLPLLTAMEQAQLERDYEHFMEERALYEEMLEKGYRNNPRRARRNGAVGTALALATGFGAGVFAEKKLGLYDEFSRRRKQSAKSKAAPKAAPVTDAKWRIERGGGYANHMRRMGGIEYIVFKSKGTKSLYYAEYIPEGSSLTKRIAGPDQLGRFLSKDDAIAAAEAHAGRAKSNPRRARRNPDEGALQRLQAGEKELSNVDLSYADLRGLNLSGVNLYNANLEHANLSFAKLSMATLRGANLHRAHLHGANLRMADVAQANLVEADLSYADLSYARLNESNLTEANLWHANLTGTNLSDAVMVDTNLYQAEGLREWPSERRPILTPVSENFRRWFGKSKVVDAEGKPLVLYHGSDKAGFTAFSKAKIDAHHPGFFFTDSRELAGTYSGGVKSDPFRWNAKQGIYQVFLRMENPYIIDAKGAWWNRIPWDKDPERKSAKTDDVGVWAKEHGYDGVIFYNVIDVGRFGTGNQKNQPQNVYLVFEPNQIKAAAENSGAYSLDNADIRYNPRRRR